MVSQMAVKLSVLSDGRPLLPRNIFSASGTDFYQRLSKPQGLVRLEVLGKLKKKTFTDLIGFRTLDLQACRIVPQPTTKGLNTTVLE
jgi:hypothetical protein